MAKGGSRPPAVRPLFTFRAREKTLALGRRTAVMGVVNVTPDSFYAGSRYRSAEQAVEAALAMSRAGADIIDLGGESTRPGAAPVTAESEMERVLPVIEALRPETDVLLSVDTSKASVAEAALARGADLVNDVTSLAADSAMAGVVARAGAGLVLMHMKGMPQTMQRDPRYEDVVAEVRESLEAAVRRAERSGVAPASILVDPGIGFGKTLEHNLVLLDRLYELGELGKPILVGTSRKSFLGRILGAQAEDRLYGTAASVAAAVLRGAHAVRVHDVREMLEVARVADAILNESAGEPS